MAALRAPSVAVRGAGAKLRERGFDVRPHEPPVSPEHDNSVAESFFATLKKELVDRRSWPEKAELRGEIFDYIESFYNRRRRHSTLGMRSPADYENSTLSPGGARDAASRLITNEKITITAPAATTNT